MISDINLSRQSSVSVIVVGAGLSGLNAAKQLSKHGLDFLILEKSRGVGGRCATRRIQNISFDHGAQFFTAHKPFFKSIANDWLEKGHTRVWSNYFPSYNGATKSDSDLYYCAPNGMNLLPKLISKDLNIKLATTVNSIERMQCGWIVKTNNGEEFKAKKIILSLPLPQSLALLNPNTKNELIQTWPELMQVEYESCFTILALLSGVSKVPQPGAIRVQGEVISWISDNTQKFNNSSQSSLTINTNSSFTNKYFEAPHDEIARIVLDEAKEWLGSKVVQWQVHRWKYAKAIGFVGLPCVTFGEPTDLVLCGDYMQPPCGIEGSVLSGLAAAKALLKYD
jgi:renalase